MGALIADQTAEKAAQYASHVERLEARLRVVEQIVTDGGAQTAAQIEALREQKKLESGDKIQ
jgi:predicted house-cleaning noncanonical NTP pyrophosphatase (MazG superfamily)